MEGREIRKIIHIVEGILEFHRELSHRLASDVLYIFARRQAITSELHANFHWSGLTGQTRRGVLQIMRLSPNIILHDAQTCMRLHENLLRIKTDACTAPNSWKRICRAFSHMKVGANAGTTEKE
jgi:hypothetical protein